LRAVDILGTPEAFKGKITENTAPVIAQESGFFFCEAKPRFLILYTMAIEKVYDYVQNNQKYYVDKLAEVVAIPRFVSYDPVSDSADYPAKRSRAGRWVLGRLGRKFG
jgi:hypothetical protein